MSGRLIIRWDRIAGAVAVGIVASALLLACLTIYSDELPAVVPACTDEIADAGGVCQGEPGAAEPRTFIVPSGPNQGDAFTLGPCLTEDSAGCYWDAQASGNLQGVPFWVEPNGTVHRAGE